MDFFSVFCVIGIVICFSILGFIVLHNMDSFDNSVSFCQENGFDGFDSKDGEGSFCYSELEDGAVEIVRITFIDGKWFFKGGN